MVECNFREAGQGRPTERASAAKTLKGDAFQTEADTVAQERSRAVPSNISSAEH